MAKRGETRSTRFDAARARIIDTSAHLFARNGYAQTGVAELGAAVDLARGALYYYIQSKEALLSAIHDRVMDPLLHDAAMIYAIKASASARLTLMSELLLQMIIEHRDHVWVFLHEYRQLSGNELKKFRRKRGEFERYISDLITAGVDDGDYDVKDVRLATLAWLNMHNHTYHWAASEPNVTVQRLSSAYSSLMLKGLAVPGFSFDDLKAEVDKARDELTDLRASQPLG